ncbi:MAG: DUF1501 domain-containing protein [Polyangiales bacterium]
MSENALDRRKFLKVIGAGAAAAATTAGPVFEAFADPPGSIDDFFVFIHAAGAWDVTVGLDPRNEARGIIDPATTTYVNSAPIPRWTARDLGNGEETFEILEPPGTSFRWGPAVGSLYEIASRCTVISGLAVNTVSHPDGTFFASTGRHLAGGKPVAASIDTIVANEFGRAQLFPSVSVRYPSTYLGEHLDARASPLRLATVDTVSKVLGRQNYNTLTADRDAVTMLLTQEAQDLARRSQHRGVADAFALQFESLRAIHRSDVRSVFDGAALRAAQPSFRYNATYQSALALNSAFAVEAMRRDLVRCVSLASASHDTHTTNYRNQMQIQQELFDTVTTLVRALDATPHPTLMGTRLGDRTHILVVSEFCRTPQINMTGGRDHYPSGSALIISPRFRGGVTFGRTDPDQLLPMPAGMFADGARPVAPPDVLATFLAAFGVDPRRYMRDGDVVRSILRA